MILQGRCSNDIMGRQCETGGKSILFELLDEGMWRSLARCVNALWVVLFLIYSNKNSSSVVASE
jgi:hypothetical protein